MFHNGVVGKILDPFQHLPDHGQGTCLFRHREGLDSRSRGVPRCIIGRNRGRMLTRLQGGRHVPFPCRVRRGKFHVHWIALHADVDPDGVWTGFPLDRDRRIYSVTQPAVPDVDADHGHVHWDSRRYRVDRKFGGIQFLALNEHGRLVRAVGYGHSRNKGEAAIGIGLGQPQDRPVHGH